MASSSKQPDQFEIFNLVVKNRRNSVLREGVAYVVAVLCLLTTLLALARPLPVIVKSDRPDEPTTIAYATTETIVRNLDAKKFFFKTAKLLHGWSSGTVMDDLREASLLMTPNWREQFLKWTDEQIDVPFSVDQRGKAERVVVWTKSFVQNKMTLSWKDTECRRAENRWHCKGRGVLSATPLMPTNEALLPDKAIEFRTTFVEVPVTQLTMDGLLIDFSDIVEVQA
jgi:hypothetical protein